MHFSRFSALNLFVHLFSGASKSKNMAHFISLGCVAQRITRLPTEQKIAGSSPAVPSEIFFVVFFFRFPSSQTILLFQFWFWRPFKGRLKSKVLPFKDIWARGATDNASDYGSEDCRFESCRARKPFLTAI